MAEREVFSKLQWDPSAADGVKSVGVAFSPFFRLILNGSPDSLSGAQFSDAFFSSFAGTQE
jgi:hypothetical protein